MLHSTSVRRNRGAMKTDAGNMTKKCEAYLKQFTINAATK
jgi:hypothetical protein